MRTDSDISMLCIPDESKIQPWITQQNKITKRAINKSATYKRLYRISYLAKKNAFAHNELWIAGNGDYITVNSTRQQPQGVLQRSGGEDYLSGNPQWKTIFDIDAFAKQEGRHWGFSDIVSDRFHSEVYTLFIFSEDGSDATIIREFDYTRGELVKNGFSLPKSRIEVLWYSQDALLVATNIDPRLPTSSDYPRTVRLLQRNQAIEEALVLFEIDQSHMMVSFEKHTHSTSTYVIFTDHIDFYQKKHYLTDDDFLLKHHLLPIPLDAEILSVFQQTALIQLNSDWQPTHDLCFKENTIISLDLEIFRRNPTAPLIELGIRTWYEAPKNSRVENLLTTKTTIYVFVCVDLCMEIIKLIPTARSVRQERIPIPHCFSKATPFATEDEPEKLFFYFETFTQPKALYTYESFTQSLTLRVQNKSYFNSSEFCTLRFEAISKDGTSVPYHLVTKRNLKKNTESPAVIRVYGGFGDNLLPSYLGLAGMTFIQDGGIYIYAHPRGGSECGLAWQKGGVRENKQNTVDDIFAIIEDLIARKITSPAYIGIKGESNGGFVAAACITQRPELFNAAFCDVPLTDMLHFHRVGTGRSWLAEYGNPEDPIERERLKKISPIHNIDPKKHFPRTFWRTTATDDRVHPRHAIAMAYQLQLSKKPALLSVKKEGGHEGLLPNEEIELLTYWYLQLLNPRRHNKQQILGKKDTHSLRLISAPQEKRKKRRAESDANRLLA